MRSGLGLPERQLKMLMKIRSARLYFLGNLICFSCTTISPTPPFQALATTSPVFRRWGSELPSPGRAVPAGRTRALRDGSGEKPLGAAARVEDPQDGHQPPLPSPRGRPSSPRVTPRAARAPHGAAVGKRCFFCPNNPRRVRCQGEGCEEPGRFIAEEILSPARADGRSGNNGRFAT